MHPDQAVSPVSNNEDTPFDDEPFEEQNYATVRKLAPSRAVPDGEYYVTGTGLYLPAPVTIF